MVRFVCLNMSSVGSRLSEGMDEMMYLFRLVYHCYVMSSI
jgi:hypothetical protein